MVILSVESEKLSILLDKLCGVVDFNKDLPMNIFTSDEFAFWFFERPLICFSEIFAGLIFESFLRFDSEVFVKFSGAENLLNSCFSLDRNDVINSAAWLSKGFEDFFNGVVGYPILFFNGSFDWIVFESSREEFGVIAVRSKTLDENLHSYLNSNFITGTDLTDLANGNTPESPIAQALLLSYEI